MLASSIAIPLPMTRFPTLFPAQYGVPGTGDVAGLRVHTTGKVLYVDPNYIGVSDLRDGTEPDAPLATIQTALSKCRPYRGDTVLVMANNLWQYGDPSLGWATPVAEAVVVNVPGVRIAGISPSSSVGVPWLVPTAQYAFTVNATDVLIEGFAFQGVGAGSYGVTAIWNGTTAHGDNVTVRQCLFDDHMLVGVSLDFAYNCEIAGCVFEGGDYGLWCDTPASNLRGNRILGNWFSDNLLGAIKLPEAEHCLIAGNWIHAAVPATGTFIDLSAGGDNMVADNWLGCPLGAAAGQYGDVNVPGAGGGDVWINNHCTDGPALSNP